MLDPVMAHVRGLRILDPVTFGVAIQESALAKYGGELPRALRAAAGPLGISESQLLRLAKGKTRFIHVATARRLAQLFPEGSTTLDDCILPPEVQILLRTYERWADNRLSVGLQGIGEWWFDDQGRLDRKMGAEQWKHRVIEFGALVSKARKLCPSFLAPLEKTFVGKSIRRQQLAYWRILEPLMDARESAFMARRWDELGDDGFIAFIKAGVTREILLLGTESEIQRAQSIAQKSAPELERAIALPPAMTFFSVTKRPLDSAYKRPWDGEYKWTPFVMPQEARSVAARRRHPPKKRKGRNKRDERE